MGDQKTELVNGYDQVCAAGGDRIIIYYIADTGRAGHGQKWMICRYVNGKKVDTDRKSAWYNHGQQVFYLFGRLDGENHQQLKKRILQQAINWVQETYGKGEFVRNRMGDYVEREVNAKFPLPPRPRKPKTPEQPTPAKSQQ